MPKSIIRKDGIGAAAVILLLLGAVAVRLSRSPSHAAVQAQSDPKAIHQRSAFKVTFGLKQKFNGRSWAGVLPNPGQVRAIAGWHLDATDRIAQPDRWDITLRTAGGDTPQKAVILDVSSPEEQPVIIYTRDGNLSFKPAEVPYGAIYYFPELNGDASVERVPWAQPLTGPEFEDDDPALIRTRSGRYWMAWVAYRTIARTGDYIDGGDQIMIAASSDGATWSRPQAITPPGDHFRVGLAEDSRGRIWCVYALQKRLETGNFDLYARVLDGETWSEEQQLTADPRPDIFHRLATDRNGNLYLVWMGFRPGPSNGPAQSDILLRVWDGSRWTEEINVSQSPDDDWEPAVATDASGRAWIAWDAYRGAGGPASYDVLLRSYSSAGLGKLQAVSATPLAEMRADVAIDAGGRVWVAWEEAGPNWGKDTGYENPKHRIHLRKGGTQIYGPPNSRTFSYRRPRLAILENEQLKQTVADPAASYPAFLQSNLFQNPHLGRDASGRIWLFLRHQLVAKGRNAGHFFDFYATTLTGAPGAQKWINPILVPGSTARQDTVLAVAPGGPDQIVAGVVGDGRRMPVPLPFDHDISVAVLELAQPAALTPQLKAFTPSDPGPALPTHPREATEVAQVRQYRIEAGGQGYKIVRGDLHRHTEISMDGAVDGSLFDLYRYALDAAALDYIAVTDHNYGAWLDTDEPESKNTDDVYQWWRTQKSADLFYVPGRFVPLYGYERSVNFPLGHRNIIHEHRGVFSFRVPKLYIAERHELVQSDAHGLWKYLRSTGGLALPHSTATSMGTDWSLRDDSLEPVTEIYQGDRNSYEHEGGPRAALSNNFGPGSGGRQPYQKGLVWNALGAGYKMGFIASSDHWSTHISYANLLVPAHETTREDIQAALRERRTYASTDNIVLDFRADSTMQGGMLSATQSPTFHVSAIGTEPILRIELIKNNRVLFSRSPEAASPDPRRLAFSFRDTAQFESGYYYVRLTQSFSPGQRDIEGEIAWSSPIYITVPGVPAR